MDADSPAYVLGILCGLALLALLFILSILYLATLSRVINKISQPRRPFPGGLAWLAFIPYFGEGWLAISQVMAAHSIRSEFVAAGRSDHHGGGFGLAVAWASCFVARTLLIFAGMALGEAHASLAAGSLFAIALAISLPQLILWILLWSRLSALNAQMPLFAPAGSQSLAPCPAQPQPASFVAPPFVAEPAPAPASTTSTVSVASQVPCAASEALAEPVAGNPSARPPL